MPVQERNPKSHSHHEVHHLRRHVKHHRILSAVALIALIIQSGMLFVGLFEPALPYRIPTNPPALNSDDLPVTLQNLTGGGMYRSNHVDVLTNGDQFYAAELDAIGKAKSFIHIECYIFEEGEVTRKMVQALAEKARQGVAVRLLIDSLGSHSTSDEFLKPLRDAGGQAAWYHSLKWYTWPRFNNRTHRELVVVDGTVGFAGGAGFADHWFKAKGKHPRWRDMMIRVEGDAATGLNAVFSENWVESTGEVLLQRYFFPFQKGPGDSLALVVGSAPRVGRSTYGRVLFQSLVAAAQKQIHIVSPYFLPDKSFIGEISRAIRDRHVEVRILVPGMKSDHMVTRTASRRLYGDLLLAGAKIYEYQPSMIHEKCMLVDGLWAVVGSTNIDKRSFGLNDEVNVAVRDSVVSQRLEQDFQTDLQYSHEVTYEEWRKRSIVERMQELIGALLQNQQ